MSREERPFQEIDIKVKGHQTGRDRFHGALQHPPRASHYRNNLTGLSQHHNLYFVAYGTCVHVYRPKFPDQSLSDEVLHFRPPCSGPFQRGVLIPGAPFIINQLVVGELGSEEVLVTTHDGGDFCVLRVHSIRQVIRAVLSKKMNQQDAAFKYLRPMILQNVGLSAWGIAIHKEARLLAISANTHQVYVWAPALTKDGEDPSAEGQSSPTDTSHETAEKRISRDEDQYFVLSGHSANIPNIAFCNSSADPEGRFLVSTDIYGIVIVWDIWRRRGVQRLVMPIGTEESFASEVLGWNVTCIPHQVFNPVATDEEFMGFYKARPLEEPPILNVSAARETVRDFASSYGDDASSSDYYAEDWSDDGGMVATTFAGIVSSQPMTVTEMIHDEPAQDQASEQAQDVEMEDGEQEGSTSSDESSEPGLPPPPPETAPDVLLPFSILHTGLDSVSLIQPPLNYLRQRGVLCRQPCRQPGFPPGAIEFGGHQRLNLTAYIPELGVFCAGNQLGRVAIFTLTQRLWTDADIEAWECDEDDIEGLWGQEAKRRKYKPGETTTPRQCLRLDWVVPFASQEEAGVRPLTPLLGIAASPVQGCSGTDDPDEYYDGPPPADLPSQEDVEKVLASQTDPLDLEIMEKVGPIDPKALAEMEEERSAAFERAVGSKPAEHPGIGVGIGAEPLPRMRWRLMLMYCDHTVLSYELRRPPGWDGSGGRALVI